MSKFDAIAASHFDYLNFEMSDDQYSIRIRYSRNARSFDSIFDSKIINDSKPIRNNDRPQTKHSDRLDKIFKTTMIFNVSVDIHFSRAKNLNH